MNRFQGYLAGKNAHIPLENFEIDNSETTPICSREVYINCQHEGVEVETQHYNFTERATNPSASEIEERMMKLNAIVFQQQAENRVLSNNVNLRLGGDRNMPLFHNEIPKEHWQKEQASIDAAVKKSIQNTPYDVRQFDPDTDIEGPNPLDNVNYETTNYAVPKEHGIGTQPQFLTEKFEIPEYKSIYDK